MYRGRAGLPSICACPGAAPRRNSAGRSCALAQCRGVPSCQIMRSRDAAPHAGDSSADALGRMRGLAGPLLASATKKAAPLPTQPAARARARRRWISTMDRRRTVPLPAARGPARALTPQQKSRSGPHTNRPRLLRSRIGPRAYLCLHRADRALRQLGDRGLVRLRQLEVAALRRVGDVLGQARAHELVLRVQHQ